MHFTPKIPMPSRVSLDQLFARVIGLVFIKALKHEALYDSVFDPIQFSSLPLFECADDEPMKQDAGNVIPRWSSCRCGSLSQ